MATQAYRDWLSAGSPWRPAQPIADIEAWAERNGITVLGTIGNTEHLTASTPQDHTPFSATAWPVPLDGYVVTAIDLENKNGLGQRIEDQFRRGELPWLKYMNHDGIHIDSRDMDGDGLAYEREHSSDKHVHLSIRTDWQNRSLGDNPFAASEGDDDLFCVHGDKNSKVQLLQYQILAAGGNLSDVGGTDSEYGDGTARELAKLVGGDGRAYGPFEMRAMDKILNRIEGGASGLPGPAGPAGPVGPAGPKGDPGDAKDVTVVVEGKVVPA